MIRGLFAQNEYGFYFIFMATRFIENWLVSMVISSQKKQLWSFCVSRQLFGGFKSIIEGFLYNYIIY